MLHKQRKNDNRIFTALGLVYRHCPGQGQLSQISVIIGDSTLAKLDDHLLLFQIHRGDGAQISVKDLTLIVVNLLDDSISNTQEIPSACQFQLPSLAWIEDLLELHIQLTRSDVSPCSRAKHLDL